MYFLRQQLITLTEAAILMFEFVGVAVLIIAGIMGVYNYIRHDPHTRLNLAKGLALGLEFKMGGEILRTVIVHEFSEILVVGGIILLRAALAFLIHWGIKSEEAEAPKSEHNHNEPIVTKETVEC